MNMAWSFCCFIHCVLKKRHQTTHNITDKWTALASCEILLRVQDDNFWILLLRQYSHPILHLFRSAHVKHHASSNLHVRSFRKFINIIQNLLVSTLSVSSLHLSVIRCLLAQLKTFLFCQAFSQTYQDPSCQGRLWVQACMRTCMWVNGNGMCQHTGSLSPSKHLLCIEAKHGKGSEERYSLGQNTACRFWRVISFIKLQNNT